MDAIAQIKSNIDNFSKLIFKFTKFIDLLFLLKHIPDEIASRLIDNDFISHISEASSHLEWINDYFDTNINRLLKKEIRKLRQNPHKMQEYADFTVDKPPVFKKRPESEADRLSFDELLSSHFQKTGIQIRPVKQRNGKQIAYKGNCACCGAPANYL